MTTERLLIGSIKLNIEEFVVIEHVMVRSHCFKEETLFCFIMIYHFTYAHALKSIKTITLFCHRSKANGKHRSKAKNTLTKICFLLTGSSRVLACKMLHN